MSNLQAELNQLAQGFVSAVLQAMKGASLSDLAGGVDQAAAAPARPRRPGRVAAAPAPRPVAQPKPGPARGAPKPAAAASRRRKRASAEEVQQQKDLALATAKQLPAGFSKGDVMRKSGASSDLGRALSLLVEEGRLTKKGDRRNTRYWVK